VIDANTLREALAYDQETGAFTWRTKHGHMLAGTSAGSISHYGYVEIRLQKKLYKAHRLAWLYVHGEWPAEQIDHINGNKADNRLCNLRPATNRENARNKPAYKRNTSGIKGVSWSKVSQKWMAMVTNEDGRYVYLGLFTDKAEAALVRAAAAQKFHGEFARN
jgi:hypothetical protein